MNCVLSPWQAAFTEQYLSSLFSLFTIYKSLLNIQRSRGINTLLGFETIHGFTTASETAYYSHGTIFKNYFKKSKRWNSVFSQITYPLDKSYDPL